MTAIDTTRPHAPFGFVEQALFRFIAAVGKWRSARATRRALSSLSDRALEDIGLSRADIARM